MGHSRSSQTGPYTHARKHTYTHVLLTHTHTHTHVSLTHTHLHGALKQGRRVQVTVVVYKQVHTHMHTSTHIHTHVSLTHTHTCITNTYTPARCAQTGAARVGHSRSLQTGPPPSEAPHTAASGTQARRTAYAGPSAQMRSHLPRS